MESQKIEFDFVVNSQGLQAIIRDIEKLKSTIKGIRSEAAKGTASGININTKEPLAEISKLKQAIESLPKNTTLGIAASGNLKYIDEWKKKAQETNGVFSSLQRTMKHHLLFGASGLMLGGMIGIPVAIANVAKETEALTTKLKQNLELADQYHHNNILLETDLKRLSDIAGIYALGFGESLPKVMDSMQLLARRFKDVEQVSYLSSVALTMAKIDNVELMVATQQLESVMLQFQLDLDGTRKFLNSYTTACHVAKINGTELLEALSRSAASFKQFNMSVDESIAAIAALATESGRTAGVVGNSFKSITANFSMDKAVEALDAYGVKLYDTNEQGLKVMRSGANVFKELMTIFSTLDAEGQQKLSLRLAGGKYQINQMLLFLQNAGDTYGKILEDIETKSSDALTMQLLRVGLETFQIKLMQLEASLQVFGKTIGDEVLPSLKNVTDGLTNGVIWLTENKESVAKLTSALVELGKVVIAYYVQQGIANAAIREGTTLLRLMYMLEGNFSAAFYGMGSSLRAFGMIAASVTIQMAALYAAINVISAAYDRFSDKSGLTGQQQDLSTQISMIEGNRNFALANSSRTGLSKDEINKIYDDQKAELSAKLTAVNDAKKQQESAATNKAMEESERAFKAIVDKAMASAQMSNPSMGDIIPSGKKGKTTSTGAKEAPDKSNEVFKLDAARNVDHMLKMSSIDADDYSSKLELLNTKQELFGTTTENVAEKLKLMHGRIGQLLGTAMEYSQLSTDYEQKATEMVANTTETKEALDALKVSWSELTKEEQKDFAEKYKEYFSDYKLLTKLMELSDKLKVEASEAQKQASKLGAEAVKATVSSTANLYETQSRMLGYDQEHETLGLGRNVTDEQKRVIELKYAVQQLVLEQQRLNEIQNNPHSDEDIKKQINAVDKLKLKIEELANVKLDNLKSEFAGMLADIATSQKSFTDTWKSLFKELQRDAVYGLFNIKNRQTGFLSKLFDGQGKSAAKVATPGKTGGLFGKHATGGIVNVPSIAGEDGEEVIIPTEKNTGNSKKLLNYASNKLGYYPGTTGDAYVPYFKNSELATQPVVNVQVQQNDANIAELKAANDLMRQQNEMLMAMVQNGNSSGQVVVVQAQASAEPIGKALQQNPEILTSILNRERSLARWR